MRVKRKWRPEVLEKLDLIESSVLDAREGVEDKSRDLDDIEDLLTRIRDDATDALELIGR